MATGDQADFARRLRATLPARWFPDAGSAPVLDGTLAGLSSAWERLYALLTYVRAQTRIATATGTFLDMIAEDFFGLSLPRFAIEGDAAYRARILRELLRERATRPALARVLTDLTGRAPWIFEPARPADTGGYRVGGVGYGVAGGWGSLMLPFQTFVVAYRPRTGGIASVGGYYLGSGWAGGGYGAGALEWVSPDMLAGQVTDAAIYDAVARTMPAGSIAWVSIQN